MEAEPNRQEDQKMEFDPPNNPDKTDNNQDQPNVGQDSPQAVPKTQTANLSYLYNKYGLSALLYCLMYFNQNLVGVTFFLCFLLHSFTYYPTR